MKEMTQVEVVIIGAGQRAAALPAFWLSWPSCASFGAQAFPRYKVGESMIPFTYFPLSDWVW